MKKTINFAIIVYIIFTIFIIISNIIYKKEDVNKDGKVNAKDLIIVQKEVLKEMEEK